MGKPFSDELALLPATYEWALRFPIAPLAAAVAKSRFPLLAVGSGGSFTVAHLACALHRRAFRALAAATTPLELVSTEVDLRDAALLLLTAGGKNPDILAAAAAALGREPRRLTVICASVGSALGRQVASSSLADLCEFALEAGRDGFLATNSLFATAMLLVRAYGEAAGEGASLPATLRQLTGTDVLPNFTSILGRETLIVLHPPALAAVAIDIESKFTEAALGQVQLADYRQFAHGRHHWLAKRGDRSAVLALGTEADAPLVERTLAEIPSRTPAVRLSLPGEGPAACLAGIVHCFELVRQAGEARDIDPGDPGVPQFGRRLYNLRAIPGPQKAGQAAATAIERKSRTPVGGSVGPSSDWVHAYHRFLDRLRHARICAVVTDYDGTLCDEVRRFDPLPAGVAAELVRLLRAGCPLGVATGRGKSVRERLREAIPSELWDRVLVGYYNGSDIVGLGEERLPDGTAGVSESLRPTAELVEAHRRFLGVAPDPGGIELRRDQITLKPSGSLDRLWQGLQGLLGTPASCKVAVLRSGHSIDIIPVDVSKRAVVERVAQMACGSADDVLCIGDQGCWPGNDHELLRCPLSLSVNLVSADPERCWNLAPAGVRESQATLGYLKLLKARRGGLLKHYERAAA